MKHLKFLTILTIVLGLIFAFGTVSHAEEGEDELQVWYDAAFEKLDAVNPDVHVTFTQDSLDNVGVTCEPYVDILSKTIGFEIVPDLPVGHTIYDDPSTPYIDGIRVNGETVDSLRVPFDVDNLNSVYTVYVKTSYAEGNTGIVAQVLDGTYDYWNLLKNPIVLLLALYYATKFILLFVTFIRKNKVAAKNNALASVSEEALHTWIAEALATNSTALVNNVAELLKPAIGQLKSGSDAVLKSMALSKSGDADASLKILDLLSKNVNVDSDALIQSVKESLLAKLKQQETAKQENLSVLHTIATSVQEASTNETEQETKSVF